MESNHRTIGLVVSMIHIELAFEQPGNPSNYTYMHRFNLHTEPTINFYIALYFPCIHTFYQLSSKPFYGIHTRTRTHRFTVVENGKDKHEDLAVELIEFSYFSRGRGQWRFLGSASYD